MTQLEPMGMGGGLFAWMVEQRQRQVLFSIQLKPAGCDVWSCGGHVATMRRAPVCKWNHADNTRAEREKETG